MENNISVDTIEGNRLIAVFDGRYRFDYRTIEDIAPEKLKYRVSWDWLMPVVEKIGKMYNPYMSVIVTKFL